MWRRLIDIAMASNEILHSGRYNVNENMYSICMRLRNHEPVTENYEFKEQEIENK